MADNPKEQLAISVQDRTEQAVRIESPLVFWLASLGDTIPPWGTLGRDAKLEEFWRTEPMLAGAVASMAFKLSSLDFKLKGPPLKVKRCTDMLRNADFGMGWVNFVTKISTDVLTTDNGAFIEILRRKRNDPTAPVLGIAQMDSSRCIRTGDPNIPVVYEDKNGKLHYMKWFQVQSLVDMPSSQERHAGLGFCAVSRVLSAAQYLRSIGIYKREKVSGKRIPGILLVQGLRRGAIEESLKEALEQQKQEGLSLYTKPIVLASPDPGLPLNAKLIELAGLPDGYNEDTIMKWYITTLALDFGTDYGEFAPLPGGNLGSASQSENMSARSRGKGPGVLMQLLEYAMNWHVLPSTVEFTFAATDPVAEGERINLRFMRARERNLRVSSMELTARQALELAVQEGDAPEAFLNPADPRIEAGIMIEQPKPEIVEVYVKQLKEMQEAYDKIERRLSTLRI